MGKILVVDASAWIAAQDPKDSFCPASRELLSRALNDQWEIQLPSFALLEVACALAGILKNSAKGRLLAEEVMLKMRVRFIPLDQEFLTRAIDCGTHQFLEGADTLYAALAERTGSALISWDKEHLNRAGGQTPTDWLLAEAP